MRWLDLTLADPAANLALDEALLEAVESGGAPGVLRTYEPPSCCVVVGYGNRVAREVDLEACVDSGTGEGAGTMPIPVLRRISGGGTVVLGPGCLAYALVLPVTANPELESVTGTNRFVMERNRSALAGLLGRPVAVQGHTDLTLGNLKFSGNSQRRRSGTVLFHGTFLLDFDLARIGRLLRRPSVEPAYREGRDHADFLVNLERTASEVKSALRTAWDANEAWLENLEHRVADLMRERYGRAEWHRRF